MIALAHPGIACVPPPDSAMTASAMGQSRCQMSVYGEGADKVLKQARGASCRARGELDTTYLDAGLRISRGDRGNCFVLTMPSKGKGN